ncbi:MAG: SOS response-associated peptidase, partial [Prochlorococcus sp.]
MCGRYQLNTEFEKLPVLLKKELPNGFEQKYAQQELIRPTDPVIVLKNEGKTTTSIMLWGFISEWAKDPFDKERPRPFNARSETVSEKKLFKGSWRHKRCLMPASGFFEKGYRISRKDEHPFWLGGIWNRWMSPEGSELES